jgi:parallel beta-helix repeat protein
LNGRTNVTIMNVIIVEFWQGIYISESCHVTVNENLVTDHYNGIIAMSSSDCLVEWNNVTSNYNDAIYFENCTNSTILGNQIRGSDLTDHDYGITMKFSSNSTISGNRIRDIEFGIGVQNSANSKVCENDVSTVNQYALWLAGSANNTLWENNVISNTIGVWLSTSSNNLFYKNNFVNNTFQVQTEGTVSDWNDTYSMGGNYWSDYDGKDSSQGQFQNQTGGDGFGDSPYIIDEKNQDYYPLMNAIPEYSPVAAATVLILSTLFLLVYRRRHSE